MHSSLGQFVFECCPGQETILPHAFSTTTIQDPTTCAWNMDTSASIFEITSYKFTFENFRVRLVKALKKLQEFDQRVVKIAMQMDVEYVLTHPEENVVVISLTDEKY
ncbi:hypothetical protein Tco_0356613 [Tanacetum coccineum]